MMNQRQQKWLRLAISFGLTLFLLLNYQNCSPLQPVGQSELPNEDGSGNDSTVRIVDDFLKTQVALFDDQVQIHYAAEQIQLDGLCPRSSKGDLKLKWSVQDPSADSGVVLTSGQVTCERGGFRVLISNLEPLDCGLDLQLVVEAPNGDRDLLLLRRRCSPLADEVQTVVDGKQCALELTLNEGAKICELVCYQQSQVISLMPQNLNTCSQLQSQVAGQ